VDDSDGIFSDFIVECVEDFERSANKLEKEQKGDLIYRIMEIIEEEDYGLGTDEMLFCVATRENVEIIKEELLRRIPKNGDSFHVEYHRGRILDLLTDLYDHLGLHSEAFMVMTKVGLKNKDDYLRLAMTLMAEGKDREGFEYVKEGVRLREGESHALDKLYFHLLNRFLEEKEVEVKEEEVINSALNLLSFHFEPETYELIKEVFEKIGKYEDLISAIKTRCKKSVAISVLLHDTHIDDAIDLAISSSMLHPTTIIEVAEVAKEGGKKEDATRLTLKALRQGLMSTNQPVSELINLLVMGLDERELKEATECVRDISIAKIFVDALLERNREYAITILERFITKMGKRDIKRYAKKLSKEHTMKICRSWVNEVINRSHIYYDDAIDIMKMVRKISEEDEWKKYIQTFIEVNKGKKKLIEKMRKAELM